MEETLNLAVHGHREAKESVLHLVSQDLARPGATPHVLGIQGPMGNGKTTLVREGVAKALRRPFVQISLGGLSDPAFLQGHSYTYEGSKWGRIVDILMETKCMNPIIYFDELDKLSSSNRSKDIEGLLIHMTDDSQNQCFNDQYFTNVPIDLSQVLFIFSFNDEFAIHPILRDRLTIIRTRPLTSPDKARILRRYLLPRTLRNVGLLDADLLLTDDGVKALITQAGDEKGVRKLKQAIECIALRILTLTTMGTDAANISCFPPALHALSPLTTPVAVDAAMVRQLARSPDPPTHPPHMYT